MIDAGPSLEAAERVSSPELIRYLVATGWTARPSRVPDISIFSKQVAGADQPILFILPTVPGFSDEIRRIADALRAVSAVEGRSLVQLVEDIRSGAAPVRQGAATEPASGFAEEDNSDPSRARRGLD
jgi:hypothetical protein